MSNGRSGGLDPAGVRRYALSGALTLLWGRWPVPRGAPAGLDRPDPIRVQPGTAVAADVETITPSETDAKLVERVRAGDGRAFDRLVRRHLRAAHAVARSKLGGNDDDADDVCQEAFMTALQRIEDCRDPERFRPWLLSIVRNKAHNYRAYLSVREAAPLEAVEPASDTDDASARVERHELRDELAEALAELTKLQRSVFVRFDMEGRDHGEIAEELGISRGASRFHLHAARRALRKRLSAHRLAWSR